MVGSITIVIKKQFYKAQDIKISSTVKDQTFGP